MPGWAHFVFWIFPPNIVNNGPYELGGTRLGGFSTAGVALGCLMMARYGIRGIFVSGKPWRLAVFFLGISMIFLGGYRAALLTVVFIFVVQFFLEGDASDKIAVRVRLDWNPRTYSHGAPGKQIALYRPTNAGLSAAESGHPS